MKGECLRRFAGWNGILSARLMWVLCVYFDIVLRVYGRWVPPVPAVAVQVMVICYDERGVRGSGVYHYTCWCPERGPGKH